ncbi:zinc finger protein 1035 [Centropristis striata]|uniref:zinc finger protein 1035 n=1 Tax=Centropristis striata TaxID=184440 RepID=UPI0027E0980B|nr:zinc finger protein 1035 [Centropristis striata]
MAHGWDSYFDNLPPLSSDPSTLRRTSESDGSLSQHIENFIGHHDFPDTVASHEAPATNSNFNTNYYSNPSIENPSSDCLYQRFCKETPWQADGQQMEKDFLPRCGNSDISDFATDGLSSPGSFPSSFTTDLQELKQDCGILATSFLEDYSDVSSCSDTDTGETRPSCKFMASNSISKPKSGAATKNSSSEWLFPDTGNMMLQTETLCPETDVILPNTSNVTAKENIVECAQDQMESSSTTPNVVTTTGNETVKDGNDDCGSLGHKKEYVERDFTQGKDLNISSGHKNLAGGGTEECPDGNQREQIAATNSMTTLDNTQDQSNEKGLRKETKESFNQKNEGCPHSTDVQDGNTSIQNKSEDQKRETKELGSLENGKFDEKKSPNPNSTGGQHENMETDCCKKEIKSNTCPSSDTPDKNVCDSTHVTHELSICTNTSKLNSHDVELCLQPSELQSCVAQDDICLSPAVMSDGRSSNGSEDNEQIVASHSDSCLEPNSSSTDVNPCVEKERTSVAEKTHTSPSPDPDCNGPCITKDNIDKKEQEVDSHEDSLQSNSPSKDMNTSLQKELTTPLENKTVSSSTESVCTDHPVTTDNKGQSISNGVESCSSPAENTNQQQSLHQSPVASQLGSVNGDAAENARDSFEESERSAEEPSALDELYGEPLSGEDSSCDADEVKLDTSHCKDTSLDRPDSTSMDCSEGQTPQLKSSTQMRKRLQPVVILKTSESVNGKTNSYHCADCQHTTHSVDHLIEHHHCCHSGHSFQFCKTCNLYLMRTEQAEEHVCCVAKESPELSSDSRLAKKRKKHIGGHRCIKCRLVFAKLVHYIRHMRTHTGTTPYKCDGCGSFFAQSSSLRKHKKIPKRCKQTMLQSQTPVTNSDVIIKETETPPPKELVEKKTDSNLGECYVKLVDASKTHGCKFCGKYFLTADKAKKHLHSIHKEKTLAVSSSQCTTKQSGVKTEKGAEKESIGKFKCPLCPRLFKYSYNRARHLRDCVHAAIYGGKGKVSGKYRCPLCHVTFTLSSNRYRHIKAFCLKECLNRLAKERAELKQRVEKKKTKETEQKVPAKKNEQKKMPREAEQQKQAPLTSPKHMHRYKCNLCPAVFCHASGKYRHMKKHEAFKLTGKMFKYRNSFSSILSKPATLGTKTEESKDDSKSAEGNRSPALSCRFCEKRFSEPQLLKRHERNHKGERPYRCLQCGKGFKQRAHLLGHKSVHQRRIQCTVCRKILPTIGELIQHRSSHPKRGMLQCPDCHLQFQYPAHLIRHVKAHKRKENKAKQREEKTPLEPQQSLEPVKEQSGPKKFLCSLCDEVFDDAQVLRKHCLTHIAGSSSNQCPFCKFNTSTRRNLLRHMIKHTGDKPLSCNNCGKQFYRDLYLKLHSEKCLPAHKRHPFTKESNDKTKGSLQCSYCPRTFFKKIRLEIHLRGHKTNTLLHCSRCGQYFGFAKLSQHQKNCKVNSELSTGEVLIPQKESVSQNAQKRPLKSKANKMLHSKCPHCPQTFRFRSLLLRHLVSHTGLQPYACMHCGQRFRSKTLCLQHEAFCDGEGKPEVKGGTATQLSKMPPVTETALKPQAGSEAEYKCKFCTKSFMKSRSLRRHILTHNEVKPYRCKACDSCFSRYDHLKVHQNRCRGRKTRLEVCIPKISLADVGTGWQNRFGIGPIEKMETFECEVCSRIFPTQSKLSRHFTMFHAVKLYSCTICGSSFSHEKTLKNHRKMKRCRRRPNVTNASLLETNQPTVNVMKPRNPILQHVQPYVNKKHKFVCSYCPRAFGNNWQLSIHNRLHTGERPYSCDDCGEKFIRKDYLQRHYLKCTAKISKSRVGQSRQSSSKSPPKGFSCAYCSSRFLLFSQLQEHFLNAHQLETKVPASTAPLQQHLSNMPDIKKEPLDEYCDEQLSDGATLRSKGDKVPDGGVPKPFSCSHCKMSFTNKAGLMGHLRIHAMKFPFNCKICSRGFWNKSLLRNHNRKCRFGSSSMRNTTKQLEGPLKAEIDFVLNDSVLVFEEASNSTGTGVLQTNFSCKDDSVDKSSQSSEEPQRQSSTTKEKKTVQYQCSECDKSFTDGLMLISHLEDHGRQEHAKKNNKCLKCGQAFSSPVYLERHMKLHKNNKKYSCPDCSKIFDTSSDLETHRTFHDSDRPFVCKLCKHRFWTRPSLCSHYREEHSDHAFACRFCNKAYSVKKSLARHIKKWHREEQRELQRSGQEKRSAEQQSSSKVSTTGESDEDTNNGSEDSDSDSAPYFPCHVCGKTFPTSESLEDHQQCHLGEKPHECAECGKCYAQASQLQQHQRMHKSEFQCQACGRGFLSLFALRKHKHTHGKSRPHRCPKCDFSFPGALQLAEHMSTHREENFPCDICNRAFHSKSSRAEHRKIHSKSDNRPVSMEEHKESGSLSESSSASFKELKYRCGVCSERFKDPEELSEHGCIAAKERPYSCSDCNKHFLHASHLKKHRNTMHGYPCNQCNSSFSSSQHFHNHLKSHVDAAAEHKHQTEGTDGTSQSFICPVCHQCFASATELICHFRMHPDGVFECKVCKMTFPSGSKLEEHNRIHVTSATEFECTECGQSFIGKEAFCQHQCSSQLHGVVETKHSNPPAETSNSETPIHYQEAAEEEEVDVTGEDLYNCPVCSMQFDSKSGLLEHQNKEHRNEKPFKCELCGKAFALRRYLRGHIKRHRQKSMAETGVEKLKCTQCRVEVDTAEELSSHMRLHAEQEVGKLRCDMCYKSFSHWSVLRHHQESHVGQIVYECTECDKAFAFPHLLEEHQQSHAGSSQ